MKTTLFTLLFALMLSVGIAQPRQIITQSETVSIWVWSVQGQATYQESGFKMARPLHEGTLLTEDADIWVSDNGQVVLLYNGTSTALGKGAHSVSKLIMTSTGDVASGFTNGTPPSPAPTGGLSGPRDDGSGFGQGVAPAPAPSGRVGGRGDEGSGFGQGAAPAPTGGTVGGRGDEGSGFGQQDGTTPDPATSDDTGQQRVSRSGDGVVPNPSLDFLNWIDRHREAGSGFGQGAAPAPTGGGVGNRGDEGSGFGQGAAPASTGGGVGGRGNEGSGFGQGAAPASTGGGVGGRGNEGSGFGQGAAPAPTGGGVGGRGNDGSGFGDGVTPSPPTSGGLSGRRDKGSGHGAVTKVAFQGGYNGKVTIGPVDYIWTPPGAGQTCQFKIWDKKSPQKPIFQANTARSGMILDLRDLNLQNEGNYVATISLTSGNATQEGTINFTIVGPEIQLIAFQNANDNLLYPVASNAHRSLLNAMELEKADLNTAATVQYQRAHELNPNSELVNAMIYSFKIKHGLQEE